MPIFNTVKDWLYDCPVEQLQPYHKSQWNRIGDLCDMLVDEAIECGEIPDFESDEISQDDLEASAAFLDRVLDSPDYTITPCNPYHYALFVIDLGVFGPINGVSKHDMCTLVDYHGKPNLKYKSVYVNGFTGDMGLYCWVTAIKHDNTSVSFSMVSVRGKFSLSDQSYTLKAGNNE